MVNREGARVLTLDEIASPPFDASMVPLMRRLAEYDFKVVGALGAARPDIYPTVYFAYDSSKTDMEALKDIVTLYHVDRRDRVVDAYRWMVDVHGHELTIDRQESSILQLGQESIRNLNTEVRRLATYISYFRRQENPE